MWVTFMVAELQPDVAEQSITTRKRVLLLEDDFQFKSILTDFLVDNAYDVVAVGNGAEGVREIMVSDFDAIVCDMMMPNLPGDMFYLAVERMRPHLCKRFIFMTGHQGIDKVNRFIQKIEGTFLPKPFHVDDLLEMIGFVQVRTVYSSFN
jgi:DNA-binding NtrC family response regulator